MLELLAPAGDKEKLKTAFYFGADACYFAGTKFGLRAFAGNFSDESLKESVEYAHSLNKKCYITINILAHNSDFSGLDVYLKFLESIKVDAVIVSDLGIMSFIKQHAPSLEIHVSTQANITNKYSAMEFVKLGAKRLILARELSINEIKEIRAALPQHIVLETFVHGAMCIAYSGRCLLSNYLSGRDSNRGACIQACRFSYSITEKSRNSDNQLEIMEDDKGTYILNSKDLNMISHIADLIDAGVTSFKIEGRMKSPYYVATVTNAYRRMIDLVVCKKEKVDIDYAMFEKELTKTSHRGYTTGFYFGEKNKEDITTSMPTQTYEFVAIVKDVSEDGVIIEQRNRFKRGDELEILSPHETFNSTYVVGDMFDEEGNIVEDALRVQQKLKLVTNIPLKTNDILRKKIENKN